MRRQVWVCEVYFDRCKDCPRADYCSFRKAAGVGSQIPDDCPLETRYVDDTKVRVE